MDDNAVRLTLINAIVKYGLYNAAGRVGRDRELEYIGKLADGTHLGNLNLVYKESSGVFMERR